MGILLQALPMPVISLITFQNQAPSQLGIDPAFGEVALWTVVLTANGISVPDGGASEAASHEGPDGRSNIGAPRAT